MHSMHSVDNYIDISTTYSIDYRTSLGDLFLSTLNAASSAEVQRRQDLTTTLESGLQPCISRAGSS